MCKVTTREAFLRAVWQYIPQGSVCAEIGVLRGDFSQMILDILKPKYLILIDPFITNKEFDYGAELQYLPTAYSTESDYEKLMVRFEKEIAGGKVICDKQFSYEAVNDYPDNFFDVIYIDASHLYEDVKLDLNNFLPKLKPNGICAGHDYGNELFGVTKSVDEFIKENNFQMIILNEQGGDFALKRK